jgi:hypothetical protein
VGITMKLHYPASAHDIYTDVGYVSEVQIGDFVVVKGSICFFSCIRDKINSNKLRNKVETPGWPF